MPDEPLDFYVIFGAKVMPGGVPSGTLRRRVEGAFANGKANPRACYIVTGGLGEHPPAEADVMARLLLERGVAEGRILRDPESVDTLASAYACARLLKPRADLGRVFVCSSPYHNPRCQALLRALGVPAERVSMPSDRPALGLATWAFYWFREAIALPYDLLLVILEKLRR